MNSQTPVERKNRLAGMLCGLTVILLFSSFTLVSRLGLASTLTLPDIAALRFAIGGTLLLPVFLRYRFSGLRFRDACALAFLGGIGFALFAYAGFSSAPASHGAVLLHGTLPLFTFALMGMTTNAKPTNGQVTGLVLISLGIIAMAWDSWSTSTLHQLCGDGSLLLASACWSAYGLLARRLGISPIHAASLVAVLSMCFFLPFYLALSGNTLVLASRNELILQGLFQGILIGAVSIFVYTRAVLLLGAAETALFTAAVPCVTTIAAMLLLSEIPSPVALSGVVIVTIGMGAAIRA